jgi:hypothetical protein
MMTESDGGAATAGTGDETETETETEIEAEIGTGTEIEAEIEIETGSGVIAAGVAIETGAAGSGRQTAACGQLNEARGTSSSELRVHKALQTVACTSLTKPRPIPKDTAQATS